MTELPDAAHSPVSIHKVGIKARDINALADYYKHAVGLAEISRQPGLIVLGAGGRPLLELEEFKTARVDDPKSAGLFHTAFLLPTRADLARWTQRAIDTQLAISGASDHLVSEAIYLTDPEGNGIEIYSDRRRSQWPREGNALKMATNPLDVRDLLTEILPGDAGWQGAPDASIVGHVHLRVGNATEAERWWKENYAMDTIANLRGSAVFMSSGGYHHHIGANSWQSAGAMKRDPDRAGLAYVELLSRTATDEASMEDPWGTNVRVVPAAA